MLILHPRRVADELRNGTLSENAKARLVLLGYLPATVFGRGALSVVRTWGDFLIMFVIAAVAFGGFWGCFRINQEGDGRAFIERFMCLSTPVWVWLYIVYFGAYYAVFAVLHNRPGLGPTQFATTVRPYFMLASLATLGVFFYCTRRLLRYVSHPALSNDH